MANEHLTKQAWRDADQASRCARGSRAHGGAGKFLTIAEIVEDTKKTIWRDLIIYGVERIKESGMTAREFYDQVVENSPDLVADGYEFKQGKTYLPPVCQ